VLDWMYHENRGRQMDLVVEWKDKLKEWVSNQNLDKEIEFANVGALFIGVNKQVTLLLWLLWFILSLYTFGVMFTLPMTLETFA